MGNSRRNQSLDSHHYSQVFQLALKVEEKNKNRHDYNSRGRGRGRDARGTHRGGYGGRSSDSKNQGDSKPTEKSSDNSSKGNYNKGRGFNSGGRGRFGSFGRSSHFSSMKFYNCGNLEHPTYRCPNKESSSYQGGRKVAYAQGEGYNITTSEVSLSL